MVSVGAKTITVDPPPSQNGNADTSLQIPDIDMCFYTNAATALSQLTTDLASLVFDEEVIGCLNMLTRTYHQ